MTEDGFWMVYTLCCECPNEPERGQIGVAHVMLNRAVERGLRLKDVALEPRQFSCFNNGRRITINHHYFVRCLESVNKAISERADGINFGGADHYHATYMTPYPDWARDMKVIETIGLHVFYRS